ncbi:hypothetical protein ACLOJK_005043 [Asimina triloba]
MGESQEQSEEIDLMTSSVPSPLVMQHAKKLGKMHEGHEEHVDDVNILEEAVEQGEHQFLIFSLVASIHATMKVPANE